MSLCSASDSVQDFLDWHDCSKIYSYFGLEATHFWSILHACTARMHQSNGGSVVDGRVTTVTDWYKSATVSNVPGAVAVYGIN